MMDDEPDYECRKLNIVFLSSLDKIDYFVKAWRLLISWKV